MMREAINCKIEKLEITKIFYDDENTLLIDASLMDYAGLDEYDRVFVSNLRTEQYFELYVITGIRYSGCVCLNIHLNSLSKRKDIIEIFIYKYIPEACIKNHRPKLIDMDKLSKTSLY